MRPGQVERGFAIRVPKAYPIYDADYAERVATIRAWLETIENLQQIGRNGLHRYNNSDHSMLTALRAVDNLLAGVGHDLWAVNAESAYHEESVPADVLSASLYARFRSRKDHTFAEKILSAMRKKFGGHVEPGSGAQGGGK